METNNFFTTISSNIMDVSVETGQHDVSNGNITSCNGYITRLSVLLWFAFLAIGLVILITPGKYSPIDYKYFFPVLDECVKRCEADDCFKLSKAEQKAYYDCTVQS